MCTRIQLLIVLLVSALLLVVVGCDKPAADTLAPSARTSSDTEVEQIEQRFAVFSPAIGVMLQELGFEDSVVGKHAYDNALGNSIPVVGTHIDVDYEMLITIDPTDVFFERNTIGIPDRVSELAKEHDWQVWTYKLETLDDIAETVDDLYLKLVGFAQEESSPNNFLEMDVDPTKKFDIELPSAHLARAWSDLGQPARDVGRVLLLAGTDPPGALGPESFHGQMLTRLGATLAIDQGGMWQELDYEDLIELAPDSILIFEPKLRSTNQIGEPEPVSFDEVLDRIGGIAELAIPAVEHKRIAFIEHPLGLLPSTSLGQVADEVAAVIRGWSKP